MKILVQVLLIFAFAIVSLLLYYGIKVKILNKYKVKKRYILVAFVLVLFLPMVPIFFFKNAVPSWFFLLQMLQMVLVTVVFLTYLEIRRLEKVERNKPVIGRPKPKPNRVKNK